MIQQKSFKQMTGNYFKIALFAILIVIVFGLLCSTNYRSLIKARIQLDSIKHINKTLLDSIKCIQYDKGYKAYLIQKECNITLPDDINWLYIDTIDYYTKKYNLLKRIVYRLVWAESNFDSTSYNKTSHAIGLFQITIPWWYTYRGYDTDYTEYNRIKCALYGLSELYNKYKDWSKVLSVYNSGKPNNKVTYKYVNWILK